jgi:hypothetical protein
MRFWFLVVCLAPIFFWGHENRETPAREWLERSYLPALSGKVLYVGVGSYTREYHLLTKTPLQFATLDYDVEKALFGSPYGHHTADFLTFQTEEPFDHVSLFGVMGHPPTVTTSKYNIIDEEAISQAVQQADRLVKVGGTLQLGPNHRDFLGQDAAFWLEQFSRPPLDKYIVIFSASFSDNIVWWGRKVRE